MSAHRRSWVAVLLVLGLCAVTSSAQEAAADCSAAVKEAQSAAQRQLEEVRAELQREKQATGETGKKMQEWQEYGNKVKAQADALQAKVAEAEQALKSKEADHAAAIKALEGQLAALQAAMAQKPSGSCDFNSVIEAAKTALVGASNAVRTEAQAIFQELQEGKTGRLTRLAVLSAEAVTNTSASAVEFVKAQADKHLPESVKQQVASATAQALELWRTHVAEAAWARPIAQRVSAVNDELKGIISKALKSNPALAPYADPVYVQLAVYAIFGLPILLVLVLPLAALGRSAGAASSRPSSSSKKSKGGAKKGPAKRV